MLGKGQPIRCLDRLRQPADFNLTPKIGRSRISRRSRPRIDLAIEGFAVSGSLIWGSSVR